MTDNTDNVIEPNDVERDAFWSAIQGAFSPDRAIYFRGYPIAVDHSVREIDYLVFHRSGTVFVVFVESIHTDELLESTREDIEEGFTVNDQFSGESRTYYPVSIARSFIRALVQRDLPIRRGVCVIWLPNIDTEKTLVRIDGDVMFLYGNNISVSDIREEFEQRNGNTRADFFSDEQWTELKSRLNPTSPIQNRTPRLNRIEQLEHAKELSNRYLNWYNKSTLIFISYRRDDSGWPAGRIYGHLTSVFDGIIFFDYSSIKPGALWANAIDQAIKDCIVQLVIIGPTWTTLTKPGATIPRILEPKDMVAHEIRMGFREKVIPIPILIDHDRMPRSNQLPIGLKNLPTRNAMLFNQDNFFTKMDFLVDRIIELLESAKL